MDHNIHHRRLTPQSYNKPEQLDEMSPGFVRNARMGLAARAGRPATKVKAAAPMGATRVAHAVRTLGTRVAQAATKKVDVGTHRYAARGATRVAQTARIGTKGAAATKPAPTAVRNSPFLKAVAPPAVKAVAPTAVKAVAPTAVKAVAPTAVKAVAPLSSWAQAELALASSEKQNQRAREALGPGKVDFEKRLSNVKSGQTKASGESHADIMAKLRAKTQSMRDELAQLNARKANRDRASVIRGARREGGLRTRITPEQQANRDRARQRVTGRAGGESYADFRKRTFGSRTSPTILPNPTKPGDRESVLRGKSAAEKASKSGRPGPNHGRRRAANEIARNLKLGRHPYDDRRYYSDYTGD